MKRLFYIALLLGLFSCNVTEIAVSNYDKNGDCYSVSMDDAINLAHVFSSDNGFISTRSSTSTVNDPFSINDETGTPMLHVINYEGGGFIIIAGDKRLRPIQAYSPLGSFSEDLKSIPLGLKIWLENTQETLNLAKEKGDVDAETRSAWARYTNRLLTRSQIPDPIPTEEVDTLVGPFITDYWHQYAPYNDNLIIAPHYYSTDDTYAGDYKPAVGCLPLAIARVMRYNMRPSNYSWSSMPDNSPQTTHTKSFISDVHYAVKSYSQSHGYNFNYFRIPEYNSLGVVTGYHSETGTDHNFPIGSFMNTHFGYSAAVTESYSINSYQKMRREMIDHLLPCIISGEVSSGGGHTWICDGYHYNYTPGHYIGEQYIEAVYTTYLHYRWGMENSNYDGWYFHSNVNLGSFDLHYNMQLTHHITDVYL